MMLNAMLETLRRTLHQCPEAAGNEIRTANIIATFLRAYKPDHLLQNIGGWGVAAIFNGHAVGPTLMVRCELDALQLEAKDNAPLGDMMADCAHLCGHDGHMAMVAGLAPLFSHDRPASGRLVLLFQPAEETGEGALRVIADPRFNEIRPDMAIGIHNLPGFPLGQVVYRAGTFACTSIGMEIFLRGQASHAAHPENALSPMGCLREILSQLPKLTDKRGERGPRLVTITHAALGQPSFGSTPGQAVVYATLRTASAVDLNQLRADAERIVYECANQCGLNVELCWRDHFPETVNDPELVEALASGCRALEISAREHDRPFRWSEDFGHFASVCPINFFGLGIGEEAPGLHQPDYYFADEVIPTGVSIYDRVIRDLLQPQM